MILTRSRLAEFGQKVWGPYWHLVLADRLGKSERTLRRWKGGRGVLPSDLRDELARVIDQQLAELQHFKERLDT